MATPEALIKYYNCLKDSFNKIQLKDNKSALVNAALRPKLRDEFVKSRDLLVSYLGYIQVFTLIYSEKFNNICVSIICPLLKENPYKLLGAKDSRDKDVAQLIHDTVKEILKSKPELVDEYVHCLTKFFPNIYSDNSEVFSNFIGNCLEACSYIRGEQLTNLIAKILDRLNPPVENIKTAEDRSCEIRKLIAEAYKLIYSRLDLWDKRQKDNFCAALLAAFTREFLTSENDPALNYLILYVCSLDNRLLDLLINLLWSTFTSTDRPFEERRASVFFTCSFMSRASFVDIDKILNYIETATAWCEDHLPGCESNEASGQEGLRYNESTELFNALIHSILYLITQRYRELYEADSIQRLKKINLDRYLNSASRPLQTCDTGTEQRFREVAALYGISILKPIERIAPDRKKRRAAVDVSKKLAWRIPYKESESSLPETVKKLYRNYYDHRNFTVYRE